MCLQCAEVEEEKHTRQGIAQTDISTDNVRQEISWKVGLDGGSWDCTGLGLEELGWIEGTGLGLGLGLGLDLGLRSWTGRRELGWNWTGLGLEEREGRGEELRWTQSKRHSHRL